MILSDSAIAALKEHTTKPFARDIHVEDATVYNLGLTDGAHILAEWILSQLKPEPAPEKDSPNNGQTQGGEENEIQSSN